MCNLAEGVGLVGIVVGPPDPSLDMNLQDHKTNSPCKFQAFVHSTAKELGLIQPAHMGKVLRFFSFVFESASNSEQTHFVHISHPSVPVCRCVCVGGGA